MRRSLELLPTTIQNVETFAEAAAIKFGSQREGDQYGAMLAGAWSLCSTRLATLEEATALIDRYEWTDYTEDSETEGSMKALGALLGCRLRVDGNREVSVYELVTAAAGRPEETVKNLDPPAADAILKRYGMRVYWRGRMHAGGELQMQNAWLLVANNSEELKRLMERTPYAADLKGQLLRVNGAMRWPNAEKFLGLTSRSVGIPVGLVLDGVIPEARVEIDDEEMAF